VENNSCRSFNKRFASNVPVDAARNEFGEHGDHAAVSRAKNRRVGSPLEADDADHWGAPTSAEMLWHPTLLVIIL
jgi:hypothetical protein